MGFTHSVLAAAVATVIAEASGDASTGGLIGIIVTVIGGGIMTTITALVITRGGRRQSTDPQPVVTLPQQTQAERDDDADDMLRLIRENDRLRKQVTAFRLFLGLRHYNTDLIKNGRETDAATFIQSEHSRPDEGSPVA